MKTKLAAFDFDFTIKEYGSMKNVVYQVFGLAKLFPDKRIPEEYLKILKEGGQWGQYFKTVQEAVNDLGVTKNEVIEAIANDGNLIEGMDELFQSLSKEHDIIIVTSNYEAFVKQFLEKHNILKYVTKIFSEPSTITEDGKFEIGSIPKDWGGSCICEVNKTAGPQQLICKKLVLQYHIKSIDSTTKYEKVIYIGDDFNDLCASLSLGSNDLIFAREGYKLDSLLKQYSSTAQAKIISWKNGLDILLHV